MAVRQVRIQLLAVAALFGAGCATYDTSSDSRDWVTREAADIDPLLVPGFDRYDLDDNDVLDRGEFARIGHERRLVARAEPAPVNRSVPPALVIDPAELARFENAREPDWVPPDDRMRPKRVGWPNL